MATNKDRPIIQSHGYNGSEPTRICPHCGKEKPLSEFGFRKMEKSEKGLIRNQSWCKDCRITSVCQARLPLRWRACF